MSKRSKPIAQFVAEVLIIFVLSGAVYEIGSELLTPNMGIVLAAITFIGLLVPVIARTRENRSVDTTSLTRHRTRGDQ